MTQSLVKLIVPCIAAVIALSVAPAMAQYQNGNLPNELFSQYATAPGASQATAGMYPAPHYVPEHVGHSYYTNQALMPHEMMYPHQRNYFNYDYSNAYYGGGAALNKTTVVWQSGASHYAPLPFTTFGLHKLSYKVKSHKYGLNSTGGYGHGGKIRGHFGGCAGGNCD